MRTGDHVRDEIQQQLRTINISINIKLSWMKIYVEEQNMNNATFTYALK